MAWPNDPTQTPLYDPQSLPPYLGGRNNSMGGINPANVPGNQIRSQAGQGGMSPGQGVTLNQGGPLPSGPMPAWDPEVMGRERMQALAGQQMIPLQGPTLSQVDQPPTPRKVVPPLPAQRLFDMFRAWETAKTGEIHEQHMARRYYHGRQWSDTEIRMLRGRRQPVVTSNRIKPKVNFLVGTEQRLRRDVKAYPRSPNSPDHPTRENGAWVATAALRFIQDQNDWASIASDVMWDALISGIGIAHQGIKVIKGRAEIEKRHVPADRFFYDPRSELWDFSDARYLGTHMWMDIDEAIEMLPQAAPMIEALAGAGGYGAAGSIAGLPQDWEKEKNWVDTQRRRIYIVEIHYKHLGEWVYDYICGALSLLPAEQTDRVSPYIDEDNRTCHPYLPWSPYVDERADRYGIVRDMFSPQDEINKRRSKMLHQLSVRQTRGDSGSVPDVDEMKRQLARPDGHVVTNPGKTFEILNQDDQIAGQFQLLSESKAELDNMGPNPALQASGPGITQQSSGRAILAQQNSGMTELSPIFERGRKWKLKSFKKDWCLIRQFYTGERFIRITDDNNAPVFIGLNQVVQHPMTGQVAIQNDIPRIDVDLILEEGPDVITMQEELLNDLAQLGPGVVPPEVLIQLSNMPKKDQLIQMLQQAKAPPPELMQLQQRMAVLEQLQKAANIDKTISDMEKNRALAEQAFAQARSTAAEAETEFPLSYRQPTIEQQLAGQMGLAGGPPPMGGQVPAPPGPGGPTAGPGGVPPQVLAAMMARPGGPQAQNPTMGGPGQLPMPQNVPNGPPSPLPPSVPLS